MSMETEGSRIAYNKNVIYLDIHVMFLDTLFIV